MENSLWGKKNWIYWITAVGILLLGLGIRLYDLTDLPLDFHPTRQLRSAIIARGLFAQMEPYEDNNIQTSVVQSMNSLEAYEPPIFESLVALTYRAAGREILWLSRIYSSVFWIVAGVFIFLLARRWNYRDGALIGLAIFLFAPFLIQASRSFQPDPFMVMWLAIFLYVLDRFMEKGGWSRAVVVGLMGGIAILVKVVAALFIIPVLICVFIYHFGWSGSIRSGKTWTIAGILVAPAVVYYGLILGGRAGGFFTSWTLGFIHLLLDTSFYADWLHMVDSLFSLSLVVIALVSIFLYTSLPNRMLVGLWVGYLLYGMTSPYQFITHTYYHLPLGLLLALSIVPVADVALKTLRPASNNRKVIVAIILLSISGYYLYVARSVQVAVDYRSEPVAWEKIGTAFPRDGAVIALTQDYGNRLMYFSMVKPADYWPTTTGQNLSEARGKGKKEFEASFEKLTGDKKYFLVTATGQLANQPDLAEKLAEYEVVDQGDGFILYNLEKTKVP